MVGSNKFTFTGKLVAGSYELTVTPPVGIAQDGHVHGQASRRNGGGSAVTAPDAGGNQLPNLRRKQLGPRNDQGDTRR